MKFIITLLGIILMGLFSVHAQDKTETKIDSLLDLVIFEDEEFLLLLDGKANYQFLYARTNFENKTYFAGRDIGIDQQNYTAQLSYFHSSGISFSTGGIWYSEFEPKYYATTLSVAYSRRLIPNSNTFRYRASFDRFFYSKSEDDVEHSFNGAFSLGITADKEFIGSRFDFSLLTGNEFAGSISWDIYGDIDLIKLGAYDAIKFEPELTFYLGTEESAYYQLGGVGRNQQYYLVEESKFGLLNTELILPITIDYKDFDLEIGYNINLPNALLDDETLPVTSYFNISLAYLISLN